MPLSFQAHKMLDFRTRSVCGQRRSAKLKPYFSFFCTGVKGRKGTKLEEGGTTDRGECIPPSPMMMMITVADETNEATEGGRRGGRAQQQTGVNETIKRGAGGRERGCGRATPLPPSNTHIRTLHTTEQALKCLLSYPHRWMRYLFQISQPQPELAAAGFSTFGMLAGSQAVMVVAALSPLSSLSHATFLNLGADKKCLEMVVSPLPPSLLFIFSLPISAVMCIINHALHDGMAAWMAAAFLNESEFFSVGGRQHHDPLDIMTAALFSAAIIK